MAGSVVADQRWFVPPPPAQGEQGFRLWYTREDVAGTPGVHTGIKTCGTNGAGNIKRIPIRRTSCVMISKSCTNSSTLRSVACVRSTNWSVGSSPKLGWYSHEKKSITFPRDHKGGFPPVCPRFASPQRAQRVHQPQRCTRSASRAGKPRRRSGRNPREHRSRREGAPYTSATRSKRSRFITLSHAATKSRTNACCESSQA